MLTAGRRWTPAAGRFTARNLGPHVSHPVVVAASGLKKSKQFILNEGFIVFMYSTLISIQSKGHEVAVYNYLSSFCV